MNLSVVLLLTAVMVTAKRDKDRIASERLIQADEAAAEPKDGDKVIAQAANDCYEGNGSGYRGRKATTVSGRKCQNWNSQTPHKHKWTPEKYPKAGLVANYCRLAGWTGGLRPWCYTMEKGKRWEYCDIPKCQGMKYQIIHERKTWAEAKDDCEARGAKLAMLQTEAEAREAGKLIKELEKLISDSGVYWVEKNLGDFFYQRQYGRRPTFGYMSGVLKGSVQSSGNRLNFICQNNHGDDGCWKWPSTCEKKNHKCCKGGCDERPNDRGNKAMRCGW